jgi:hypothetical protein
LDCSDDLGEARFRRRDFDAGDLFVGSFLVDVSVALDYWILGSDESGFLAPRQVSGRRQR